MNDAGVSPDAGECGAAREVCGDGCCGEGARCCEAASLGLPDDLCVPEDEACPLACPAGDGACPIGAYCLMESEASCVDECEPLQRCGFNGCCPTGVGCVDGECALPDLVLGPALGSPLLTARNYAPDACEVAGGCVAAGDRVVVPLEPVLENVGAGDLLLGLPSSSAFADETCTGARVLDGWLTWQLLDGDELVVAAGELDVECVADGAPIDEDGFAPAMSCAFQACRRASRPTPRRSAAAG